MGIISHLNLEANILHDIYLKSKYFKSNSCNEQHNIQYTVAQHTNLKHDQQMLIQ